MLAGMRVMWLGGESALVNVAAAALGAPEEHGNGVKLVCHVWRYTGVAASWWRALS